MRHLPVLGRMLPVLALVAVTFGVGISGAEAGTARACRHPVFVTSTWDGRSIGRYYADSDMWNASGYHVSQTMRVCSPGNWSATATTRSVDGSVKTYPNVHRDYHNWDTGHEPRLRTFTTIGSRFASRSPRAGIYDGAYDIWLDGVASSGSTEVMIWTDNHRQVPAGSVVERRLRFSHRTWKLWSDGRGYLAFVPGKPLHRGSVRILPRLRYLVRHGYLARGSTLGQICFGYEIVSTGGSPATFKIDRFSVTSKRK
jgi:Glycosyl hydrolase family 12